jgi:dynein heavy chain
MMPLSVFSDPFACLTAVSHRLLRSSNGQNPVLEFDAEILDAEPSQAPEIGIYLTGMWFEGARWDPEAKELVDPEDGVLFAPAPVIHLIPTARSTQVGPRYFQCPILSILHSDSDVEWKGPRVKMITAIPIPTSKTGDFWVLRGAALLLSTDEIAPIP